MIKKLATCVGEFKRDSLLAPTFVTLETIMEVLIPLLLSFLIDKGIEPGDTGFIVKMGLLLILAAGLAMLFGILSGFHAARASSGFAKNIRKKLYYTVQEFSFSNIDKLSTSSLITRMTTDVTNVQHAYQMVIRIAFRAPAMLIFSLIMAFSINHRLSLVFLGVIPFLGIGLYFIIKKAHPIFRKVFKTYDKMNTVVQENLMGIRVVKSFVREEYEKKKFHDVSKTIFKDFSKAEKILAFNAPLMQFSIYVSIILLSWFGAKMIVSGTLTTDNWSACLHIPPKYCLVSGCSMIFVMITISRASAERIVEVFDEESDLKNPEHPVYEVKNGEIQFKDVWFNYSKDAENPVLKNINFTIQSGETVGILGGTGSSKSSLVQLIPRLYDVTDGSVLVGGVDVRKYDLQTLRDEVAMVLQKNVLFSGTIKENLRWGNKNATDEELIRVCKLAQAHDFIMKFPDGYDTYIERGGTNVSGGQKQRLTIARALLKPKILILDDSTSAVDENRSSSGRPFVKRSQIQQKSSLHSGLLPLWMRQIIIMDNGMIQAIGTHDELLQSNAIYQELFHSQQKGEIYNDKNKQQTKYCSSRHGEKFQSMQKDKTNPPRPKADLSTIKRLFVHFRIINCCFPSC